jgi:hypothetical protein
VPQPHPRGQALVGAGKLFADGTFLALGTTYRDHRDLYHIALHRRSTESGPVSKSQLWPYVKADIPIHLQANSIQAVAPFNPRPLLQSLYAYDIPPRARCTPRAHTDKSQRRQRHRCPVKVGRDRIQGKTRVGGPLHEHSTLQH